MVMGQVMFNILTAIVILSFLWRFQINSAIWKKSGTDERTTDGPTDGQTLIWRKDTQSYIYGFTMIWPPLLTDVSIKYYFY